MRPTSELPAHLQQLIESGAERTSGLLCLKCQGGRTRERSLGLYVFAGYVALKCRRASCGYFERFALVGANRERWQNAPRVERAREFDGALSRVPASGRRYLEQRYRIRGRTLDVFGVKQVVGIKALHMPVWSPLAERRGATVRRFDGWGRKAESFKRSEGPWQSWYLADNPRGLVLVEDQLSAMRCWQLGYDAVALLGTALSADRAHEISWHVTRRLPETVLIALDADAFTDSLTLLQRYPWLDRAVLLEHDIKDISDEEIKERLGSGRERDHSGDPEGA